MMSTMSHSCPSSSEESSPAPSSISAQEIVATTAPTSALPIAHTNAPPSPTIKGSTRWSEWEDRQLAYLLQEARRYVKTFLGQSP